MSGWWFALSAASATPIDERNRRGERRELEDAHERVVLLLPFVHHGTIPQELRFARRGAWRSLVSALVWGTRGRRFESGRPDFVRGCKAFVALWCRLLHSLRPRSSVAPAGTREGSGRPAEDRERRDAMSMLLRKRTWRGALAVLCGLCIAAGIAAATTSGAANEVPVDHQLCYTAAGKFAPAERAEGDPVQPVQPQRLHAADQACAGVALQPGAEDRQGRRPGRSTRSSPPIRARTSRVCRSPCPPVRRCRPRRSWSRTSSGAQRCISSSRICSACRRGRA